MITKTNWMDFSSFDSGNLLSTINRVLPPWVSLLLVVVIGWQIGKIAWMLAPGPAAGDPVILPAAAPASAGGSSTATDVQAIAAAHMFGIADEAPPSEIAPVVAEDENLADTRLTNLVLKGTIASDNAEFSVAVIADGKAEQRVYLIGDSIGSGASLHAVYADRVVLNEKGALTNLRLPSEFPTTQARPTRRATSTSRTASRNNTQSIQNVVTQNLTKLTDVIRPTPYLVNGQQAGYRVYPGRDRKQFAALGLRPGDLIKDIDGQSLTDPTQAMQIFQALGTSEQVTVTVERNGEQQSLVLKTSQLDLTGEQTK